MVHSFFFLFFHLVSIDDIDILQQPNIEEETTTTKRISDGEDEEEAEVTVGEGEAKMKIQAT